MQLCDGVRHGINDALCADAIEVGRFVAAAANLEHIKLASDRCGGPSFITKMCVPDAQHSEGREAEKRRQVELVSQQRMCGDVVIALEDRDEGIGSDELRCV